MKRLISVKAIKDEFMDDGNQFITKGKIYPIKSQDEHSFTIKSDVSEIHYFYFNDNSDSYFKFIYDVNDHQTITDLYYSLWNKQISSNNKLREKNSKLRKELSDLMVFLSDTYKLMSEYMDKTSNDNELIEVLHCQIYSILKSGGKKI